MNCRFCGKILAHEFIDLGCAPPSNAYLTARDLNRPEVYYPLKLRVCNNCWLAHARHYSQSITERLSLNSNKSVVEIACNDGYLLKNFVEAGIPCLGIEPTASTAAAAQNQNIPVLQDFFGQTLGRRLASEGKKADLIIGNNVYADEL